MDPIVVKLATFVAAVLAVVGVFSVISDLVLRDKARIKARLDQEFGDERQREARKSEILKDLKLFHAETSRHVPEVWKRFKRGRDQQLGYFDALLTIFKNSGGNRIVDELERVIDELKEISANEAA